MADDQQFCLRWNNHQSTLISVFDTLLENGTLVDCTLAAEGQSLKAHKVVLSACSPYLETLLSEHYEKHPIIIMKDVKFTELKSMMDYMYRGEVNICQDQLGTFLKAAESLQIKGLSENGEGDARDVGSTTTRPPPPKRPPATPAARTDPEQPPAASPAHRPRDGSISPSSRKRRRTRRNSDDANHFDSNSCDLPLTPAQSTPVVPNIPASITSTPIRTPVVKPEINDRLDHNSLPPESGLLKEKIEPAEQLLEPKTEYLEDLNNDDSVEDLTLDDDDEMDMSQMSNMSNMSRPGPSHGTDISNQGFSPWQLGNQSGGNDEVFMAAQEAVNSHRDSQDDENAGVVFRCEKCEQCYETQSQLDAHTRQVSSLSALYEYCFVCDHPVKDSAGLMEHLQSHHPETEIYTTYICECCARTFHTVQDTMCHLRTCEFAATLEEFVIPDNSAELDNSYNSKGEEPEALVKKAIEMLELPEEKPEGIKLFDVKESAGKDEQVNVNVEINKTERKKKAAKIQDQAVKVTSNSTTTKRKNLCTAYDRAVESMDFFFNQRELYQIKKGYTCPDCNKVYTSFGTAKAHLKTECNKEPENYCHLCDYKTRQSTNLKRHIRLMHHSPEKYVCCHCSKEYTNKAHFTHHIRYDCPKANPVKCQLCDFHTKIPGILNSHLLKKHHIYQQPKDKSAPLVEFPDPVKVPEGFKCPDCDRCYRHVPEYKRHRLLSCGKTKSLRCIVRACAYITKNYINMQGHLKRKHNLVTTVKKNQMILLG